MSSRNRAAGTIVKLTALPPVSNPWLLVLSVMLLCFRDRTGHIGNGDGLSDPAFCGSTRDCVTLAFWVCSPRHVIVAAGDVD